MGPSLQTRLPTRCIYRQLLREASYLPPLCQPFAKEQIRSRFRKHIYDPVDDPSTKTRIRRAQHDLRYLRAANHGVAANMFRILMLTFGRLGKRRRELIKVLLRPVPPADSAELAKQIDEGKQQDAEFPAHKKLPPDWLDKWDLNKLNAVASTQAKQSFWSPRADLKNKLDPEENLPETNAWGRPLPAKLKRSKVRKWHKGLIHKVMPPVGRDEWETLGLLATGQADKSLWKPPPRRPLAMSLHQPGEKADDDSNGGVPWDWKAYATQAVRHIERGSSRSRKAWTGEEGEAPWGLGSPLGLQDYHRTRFWTRMYAKIWAMTPVMGTDPTTKTGWRVEWGKIRREIPEAMPAQMGFFEGAEMAKNPRPRKMKKK